MNIRSCLTCHHKRGTKGIAELKHQWIEKSVQPLLSDLPGGPRFMPDTLALAMLAMEEGNSKVCPLGSLTACWALDGAGVQQCQRTDEALKLQGLLRYAKISVQAFPLLAAIGSRWPLLRFLALAHRDLHASSSLEVGGLHGH